MSTMTLQLGKPPVMQMRNTDYQQRQRSRAQGVVPDGVLDTALGAAQAILLEEGIDFEPMHPARRANRRAPKPDLRLSLEHTLLNPLATQDQILHLCREAVNLGVVGVCVPPRFVQLTASTVHQQGLEVVTVIDFPLGYGGNASKVYQVEQALANGATEVDVVPWLGGLNPGKYRNYLAELEACREASAGARMKVIIEASLLTDVDIVIASALAELSGADYVKSDTGMALLPGAHPALVGQATPYAVSLMRAAVTAKTRIKAAGGIQDMRRAKQLLEAGASRLGSSSCAKLLGLEA